MTDPAADLLLSKKEVTLEFKNLFYKPKSNQIKSDILKDVSGKFNSGRLTAILGPSGAGKTSLLNVLSGFKQSGFRGEILVNGHEQKRYEFRKISSYIPQEFAMLDKLTVQETLQNSADLKLGLRTKQSLKQNVIDGITKLLNLEKCSNTLVERLSGGERKRLSIGIELVTNPPIMLFDEPTSGLDSVSSYQVLIHLQKLAHAGRTVVCVIHQPSSRLLTLFDDIVVLSDGECIYNGTEKDMVSAFKSCGFICPSYYNPADFVIEVASKEHGSDLSDLILANRDKYSGDDGILHDVKSNDIAIVPTIMNGVNKEKVTSVLDSNDYNKFYPATFCEQFRIITVRSMRAMMRDKLCVQLRVVIYVVIAFLLGTVFYDVGNDASKILSNNSYLFFTTMFVYFANAMPTILTCPLEAKVFLREHMNNWYSIPAYYFAKLTSDLPLQLICPTIFNIISYYLTGQPYDLNRFLMFWGICLLTGILGLSIALAVGSIVSMNTSVFIVPASTIPVLVFSGFFIRFDQLPKFYQPLTYLSYFRYSFEGSVQAIYGYNRTNLECRAPFCYYKSTTKFLNDMNMSGDRYGYDILGLLSWVIFMQLILYLSLSIRAKRAN